jgi:ABC-type microcin C transport system permease subunit YejE
MVTVIAAVFMTQFFAIVFLLLNYGWAYFACIIPHMFLNMGGSPVTSIRRSQHSRGRH